MNHRYILTVLLKNLFLFKCRLPTLRLTPLLTLLLLPFALTRLICHHKRIRPPPSLFTPTLDAVVLSAFPIVWFFGFLYYTDVPSLLFVILTVVAASQGRHWLASMVRDLRAFQEKVARVSNTVRLYQLHVSPDKHNLGTICVCLEPANVLALSACTARRRGARQTL